ncbi:FecR domain-containing protein [bacterium]|nr:FecR domain-containing protein [bacterium]
MKKLTLLSILIFTQSLVFAQEIVTLKPNESLRTLAQKYFQNPDEWEIILLFNGFHSVNEVNEGTKLTIPTNLYKLLTNNLNEYQKIINLANKDGAAILSKNKISSALENYEKAMNFKKKGQLELAQKSSLEALNFAKKALQETNEKRLQSISAVLKEKKGTVETKKTNEIVWFSAKEMQELWEKQRVRTLTNSNGQIAFVDGSRLQLGENALAVIESMKQDLVTNTNLTDVVVLQGDVSTYLASLSKKNTINVSAPGVETKSRSKNFWTGRDSENVVRIANYDGEIQMLANGKEVLVKQNEGSKVLPGKPPTEPQKLLPAPEILFPQNQEKIVADKIDFKWKSVNDALNYFLQISSTRNFTEILKTETTLATSYTWEPQESGVFYFRVCSVDSDKLPGPYSNSVDFIVSTDENPPFLLVENLQNGDVFITENITVKGKTDGFSTVKINGENAQVGTNGSFSFPLKLVEGKQTVTIVAKNSSGKTSEIEAEIYCNLDEKLFTLEAQKNLIVNVAFFELKAKVKPLTEVFVNNQRVNLNQDKLQFLFPLREGSNNLKISAKNQNGQTEEENLMIVADFTLPKIETKEVVFYTNEREFELSGSISEEVKLKINNKETKLSDKNFSQRVLLNAGKNIFSLIAEDFAGNVTTKEIVVFSEENTVILSSVLSQTNVSGGENVKITVKIKERKSGLARTGNFVLQVEGIEVKGLLKLVTGSNTYEGNVIIPSQAKGELKLKEIKINDYRE